MKYNPVYIIYTQALNYLCEEERNILNKKLSKYKSYSLPFFKNLLLNFDIEKFKTNPVIPEDIWLYNYIKYEVTNKIPKSKLISKYEKEIFIPKIINSNS